MSKLIKQIHDLVDIAYNKGMTNYWSRPQIDAAVFAAVNELFRVCSKDYPETLLSRGYMLALQRQVDVVLTAGIGDLPADFSHEIEFFVKSTGQRIPVKERGYWDTAKRDPVDVPTTAKPIATIFSINGTAKKVEVYPTTATSPIGLLYFKMPAQPSYKTTFPLGVETYDDATSVDVDFPATLHDIIVEKALIPLGLGVQNGQAVRIGVNAQMKDQKI